MKKTEILDLVGEWERAKILCQAMFAACGKTDILRTAQVESAFSGIMHKQGNNQAALEYAQLSYEHYAKLNDLAGQCEVLGKLGDVYKENGDYKKSMELYCTQKSNALELGDHKSLIKAVRNIGIINLRQDRYAEAVKYFEEDLVLCRKTGDSYGEGLSLGNLGLALWRMGDLGKAMSHFQKKLEISLRLGDKQSIAYALGNRGLVFYSREEYPRALEMFQKQLEILEIIGDQRGRANALCNISAICVNQGNFDKALNYGLKNLEVSQQTGNQGNIIRAMSSLGVTYKNMAEYEKALDCFRRSLELSRQMEQPYDICFNLFSLAEIMFEAGRHGEAGELNFQALLIAEEISDRELRYNAEVLRAKIHSGTDKTEAGKCLLALLERYDATAEKAAIYYELYIMDGNESHRNDAVCLYRELSDKTTNCRYAARLKELEAQSQ